MEQHFICTTCGVQYEASTDVPASCLICNDDRQYINAGGQSWTTLPAVNRQHRNVFELVAQGVYAIYSTPAFAIGQRAHLLLSPGGNILWDCVTNLDTTTVSLIKTLGSLRAIAISHPHYYSTIVEWSKAFGGVPVYISKADEQWLTRRHASIHLWEGDRLPLWDDLLLVRCGGHFPGAAVLHQPQGQGRLFVGDTIQVTPGNNLVSFMYSYPNMIPLPKKEIMAINASVSDLAYDAMFGAFGKYIYSGAKEAMRISVERYLQIYED
jgi:glyoxylase-like metal-dependent hydrolase (beta-lactamase superfamily II)